MTLERYKKLLEDEAKLAALEAGGVENWDWYFDSLDDFGYEKECERIQSLTEIER